MTTTISLLAKDIRQCDDELEVIHDDYECISKWSDKVGFWITVKRIEIPHEATVTDRMREFLEKKFEKRADILKRKDQLATEAFQNFKALLARLFKEDDNLQACKELAPDDSSSLMMLINDMESIHAAINTYYTGSVTTKEGQQYLRSLSEITLKSINMLENGEIVPLNLHNNSKVDENIHKLSKIFATVKPTVRREIMDALNYFIQQALGCFILYRFPVEIIKGQPPIYLSRFIPHVVLGIFLPKYKVNFAEYVL